MTTVFGDYRTDVVAKLRVGAPTGVVVTANPAVNPPAILVDLIRGVESSGIGAWECELPIRCIAQPPGDAAAVLTLEKLLDHVLSVMGFAPWDYGTLRPTVDLEYPVYTLTYSVQIPNPRC